jgi:hypothetical protein
MTAIPIDAVTHIEDFGYLLLEAQKDLERVRQRLDALPGNQVRNQDIQRRRLLLSIDYWC